MRRIFILIATLLMVGVTSVAQAHQTSLSYVSVLRQDETVEIRLAIAFRDLEAVIGLDADLDGRIKWGEAKARMPDVLTYVAARLTLDAGGPCPLTPLSQNPSHRDGEGVLEMAFEGTCPRSDRRLVLTDKAIFDVDPTHRVLLHANMDGRETSQVLTATEPTATLSVTGGGAVATLLHFVLEGVDHLLSGPDHLLFLLVLILPAIVGRTDSRAAVWGVVLAVTGFTLGHALTLSAATTGYLRPPTRLVEILIALSVFVTAVDNIRPFIRAPRSTLAFAFGLIHGFGFASALGALNLSGTMLALGLIGFNIGIELAQIALVLAVFPLLYAVKDTAKRLHLLPFGASLLAAGIAAWWIVARIQAWA